MGYSEQYTELKKANDKLKNEFDKRKTKVLEYAKQNFVGKKIKSNVTGTSDTVIGVEGWIDSREKVDLGLKVSRGENSPVLYRTSLQYDIGKWSEVIQKLQNIFDQINKNDKNLYNLKRWADQEEARKQKEEKIRMEKEIASNSRPYEYDEDYKTVPIEKWKEAYELVKAKDPLGQGEKRQFGESRPVYLKEDGVVFINAAVALRYANNQLKQDILDGERDTGKDGDILYKKATANKDTKIRNTDITRAFRFATPYHIRTSIMNRYGIDLEEMN